MKTITHVIRAGAIEAGHAIQLDLEYADKTQESLRCEMHTAPNLGRAIIQAAATAAKLQRATPGTHLDVVDPYRATNCRTAATQDQTLVVLEFATEAVVPVQNAMTPALAQTTIERLALELQRLGTQPPSQKH